MNATFDPTGRLVVVPVILTGPNGSARFQFAVDTAATRTAISGIVLDRLGYREPTSSEQFQVRTGSGGTRAGLVRVSRLTALGEGRTNHEALWLPLPPTSLIDGLLGLDFFRGLILTLDFSRGLVSLKPPVLPRRWWQFLR